MNFSELKAAIIKSLDLVKEYSELGVKFTSKTESNSKGWVPCHAIGREDKSPSAAINLESGVYKDQGGEGACYSLFDFAVRSGAFADWKAALTEYAKRAGLAKKLPKKWDGLQPDEKLDWCSTWNPLVCRGFVKKYSGVTIDSLLEVGSKLSRYPAKSANPTYCLTWPVYGPELLDAPARGFVIQSADGGDIPLYQGEGNAQKPTKRLVIGKSGLVGSHGLRLIQEGKAKRVFKTEGISDLIRLQAAIPVKLRDEIAVITNAAGAGEIDVPKEFAPIFAGLEVVLVHDADEPGQNGAKVWLGTVGKYAAKIWNVQLFDLIDPNHGRDLRDWLAEHSFEELQGLVEVTTPFVADGTLRTGSGELNRTQQNSTQPSSDNLSPTQAILKRLGVVVLGHDAATGRIKFFTQRDGLVWEIKDLNRFKMPDMILHFGLDVVEQNINMGVDPDPAKLTSKQVHMAIAAEGNSRRIVDEKTLGPGIWEMSGRLVLVGPGKALLVNGGIETMTVPFAGESLLDFSGSKWFDEEHVRNAWAESASDPAWCQRVIDDAIALFKRWDNWKHGDSAELIAALVCCSWVQTVWPVRPIVGLTGGSNTGKTILIRTLKSIFNGLLVACAKPSEPGIRQAIKNSAKVLLIDEMESGPHRKAVFELLRTTTRGDEIIRGTASQKGTTFGLKHLIWVSSIELGLFEAADANRTIVCELERVDLSQGSKLIEPDFAEMVALGQRLLIVAMRNWKNALGMLNEMKRPSYGAHDRRLVELYSVPIAMLASVYGADVKEAQSLLQEHLDGRHEVTEVESNETDLLMAILTADVRQTTGGKNETVGAMVASDDGFRDVKALEGVGIKIVDLPGGSRGLFLHPKTVRSKLLWKTNYAEKDLKQLLARIPGSIADAREYLCSARPRGITLPMESIGEFVGNGMQNKLF